jgi:hypothetical protein
VLRGFQRISFVLLSGSVMGAAALLWSADAVAQEPAAPPSVPETAEPPDPAAPQAAPEPEAAPPAEPIAPAVAAEAPKPAGPPPPPESLIPDGEAPPQRSMPPAFPPAIPSIDYGARLRTALVFQDSADPEKLSDLGQFLEADLYMVGQVHRFWKWQVAFHMDYGQGPVPGAANIVNVQPLDVIGMFEPMPEFNIYAGRMLVQADRFSPGGPWGIDEFFYPGFFLGGGPPALPKAGPVGRDLGTTVWGAPFGGHFKYYLGAFQLHDPALGPLYTGRLQLSLLSPEPAFFQRTTYYGTKDLLSFGVGAQYQKNGTVQRLPPVTDPAAPPVVPLTDDHTLLTADVNFEKTLGDAGTASLVGQFTAFGGDYQYWDTYWMVSAGYMLPQVIGIGKLRASVRYQSAARNIADADSTSLIDAQLSYIVAAWYARLGLGFRHGSTFVPPAGAAAASTLTSNQIYLGLTLADP